MIGRRRLLFQVVADRAKQSVARKRLHQDQIGTIRARFTRSLGFVLAHQNNERDAAGAFIGANGAQQAEFELDARRRAYVHVARGRVSVKGVKLEAGDALKVEKETTLRFEQGEQAEVLVFELSGVQPTPSFVSAYPTAEQAQPA